MQIQCGFRLFIVLLASVIYNSVLLGQSIPWFALNGHDAVKTILINPAFQFEDKMKSSIQVGTILMDGLERDVVGYELKLNPSNSNKIFFSTQISYGGPGCIRVFKNGFSAGVISGMEFHHNLNMHH